MWSATVKDDLSAFTSAKGNAATSPVLTCCCRISEARVLIGDKGYDSNKIRSLLLEQGITPCIPSRRNRNKKVPYSKRLYKMRHKVENLFAKLKDWRPIATRYDRCAHIFLSAVLLAATLFFWLSVLTLAIASLPGN